MSLFSTFFPRIGRKVPSPVGWPVPAKVACVSVDEFRSLVDIAKRYGFSRNGKKCQPYGKENENVQYILLPFLPEQNPEELWICSVVRIPMKGQEVYQRNLRRKCGNLDVRVKDFANLGEVRGTELVRIIQQLAWETDRGDLSTG